MKVNISATSNAVVNFGMVAVNVLTESRDKLNVQEPTYRGGLELN